MKLTIAFLMSLFAFSALADDTISGTIRRIEKEHQVECRYQDSSRSYCFGLGPQELTPCRYTKTYTCSSDSDYFQVELKVKEAYNFSSDSRESRVMDVIFR